MVDHGEDGDTAEAMQLRSHGHGEVTAIILYRWSTIAGCITCQNFESHSTQVKKQIRQPLSRMESTHTLEDGTVELSTFTGTAFKLGKGQRLSVIDPTGAQVADLVAYNSHDTGEVLSNGRTLDYASRLYLTTGDPIYSNRSCVMLKIVKDTCKRHDFLLTPCSEDTFRIIYNDQDPAPGCFGNLAHSLEKFGIVEDQIPCAFNCFMNVVVDGTTGELKVDPPISKPGDHIDFVAEMDLIVGLTACSALQSNGGSFKPIQYHIRT